MKNIIFSTTRQWNPGDEFILKGILNIFDALEQNYNPVIFNRNPDIRPFFQDFQLFRTSKLTPGFKGVRGTCTLEANLRFGFYDNSIKPDMDCSFADWVVFAGTPEWCNGRVYDLYMSILKHNLPVMILGVGGGGTPYRAAYNDVIKKAKAFTVRDRDTMGGAQANGFSPLLLPCPALLAAHHAQERKVKAVKRIGLVYQGSVDQATIWNSLSAEAHIYQTALFQKIIEHYGPQIEIGIICHYVDELPLAKKQFPQLDMFYSFDSNDYATIYRQFDLVISSRVHGVGMAASLGIPGIILAHDFRSVTCEEFLADTIAIGADAPAALQIIDNAIANAPEKSQNLLNHKAGTMTIYKEIVRQALDNPGVTYDQPAEPVPEKHYDLDELTSIINLDHLLPQRKAG